MGTESEDLTRYPDNWEDRAGPLLKSRSLKVEDFSNMVFRDSLCPAAVKSAYSVYRELPENIKRNNDDIAEDLGISRATFYRFSNGTVNGVAVMGVLINLVGRIPAIDVRMLLFRIAAEVLQRIREDFLGASSDPLTPIEFAALHRFMLTELSVRYDGEESFEATDPEELYGEVTDVWRELEKTYSTTDVRIDELLTTILEWRHAYLLFRVSIDRWEFPYVQ